jgi:soluble lytic murein transglycosylase-like protein
MNLSFDKMHVPAGGRTISPALGAKSEAKPGQNIDPKWKAALDFEAMFKGQLMKGMRNSISHDPMNAPSQARQMFTEMLDQQYASQSSLSTSHLSADAPSRAKSGALKSLAAQIYRSMIRHDAAVLNGESVPVPTYPSFALPQAGKTPTMRLDKDTLQTLAASAGQKHGLPASLIRSVIQTESAGDSTAVSSAGAKGLMQLMDGTAKDLGVKDSFDPMANVDGGTRYLKQMLKRFGGDIEKALAGYNAGPGAVEKHGGIPPYKETQNYVSTVMRRMREYEANARKPGE